MFNNAREITVGDIVMFHQNSHGHPWVGIVEPNPPRYDLDRSAVFVRWWFLNSKDWSAKQRIPRSMLYLIGELPAWAEWE